MKSKEDMKAILVASIKNTDAFKDNQQVKIKTVTEKDCKETLRLLDKALIDARKRIIYLSLRQGQELQELKKVTKCNMSELVKKGNDSQSHIYFLNNLHKLCLNNNQLYHSDLSLSFFKENMRKIQEICEDKILLR